jgi:hypothetical protein
MTHHEAPKQEGPGPHPRVVEAIAVVEAVGGEVFVDEIIEIELCAREDRHPPHARGYAILVDGQRYVFHKAQVTGAQILEIAKKIPPKNYILREFFRDGRFAKIELTQVVELRRRGLERFKTMPKTAQDGQ